jgi:outer membrane protein assembly factor BamB
MKERGLSILQFAFPGLAASLCAAMLCTSISAPAARAANVTTYHYDNLRTGWNQDETVLTPAAVASSQFKVIASTVLDEQVDAQPLVVTNQKIVGKGVHDVVYVATENNSVYAIDASTGEVLIQKNFGTPVPYTALPGQCTDNGPNIGITSTPVINLASRRMFVMTYTFESGNPVYRVHKLALTTLNDVIPPVVVTGTGRLADGSSYTFDSVVSRQRAGLLLANNNVYAAFAGFCDVSADISRGWVLGWRANTLTPLQNNELTVKATESPNNFFLTGIWMSGFGLASSLAGDIYFVTGNSDPSGTEFNRIFNISESVVQVGARLARVKSLFTPTDWPGLEVSDFDFGSGGVMLLPPQPGAPSNLAVAAGKVGQMYLLNADDLTNGGQTGNNKVLDVVDIGSCWCGESYFQGPDGIGRVISSGGNTVRVWKVNTSPALDLVQEFVTADVENNQHPGVFTSVSSNGVSASSAVIWALGRPLDHNPGYLKLYAFDASSGATLFSGTAGTWPYQGDANLVPVVANGKVYVASNQTLAIFGLGTAAAASALPTPKPPVDMRAKLARGEHEIYGKVRAINDAKLTVGPLHNVHRVEPAAKPLGAASTTTRGASWSP